jgi:hypothetical protein
LKKGSQGVRWVLPQFLVVLVLIAAAFSILDTAFISRYLGADSGALGILGASVIGSITLIPGFVAFPAAAASWKEERGPHR